MEDKLDELSADIILHEARCCGFGQFKNFKVFKRRRAYARCSIAYFDETARLMIGSETHGVPVSRDVVEPLLHRRL